MPKPARSDEGQGLHKALTHPLRSKILCTVQTQGHSSPGRFSTKHKVSLNVAAYHFHVLADLGAIDLVDTVPRRGATEHVYAINPKSPVLDLMRATSLLQQVTEADGSLDPEAVAGNGADLAILPVEVDGEGLEELREMMAAVKSGLREIGQSCRRRLAQTSEAPISIRVGLATYSSDAIGASPPALGLEGEGIS